MPRFSVIVPVFNVQGFLRECLDSVLGQSFTDLELIAVDDCSPDHSGTILDEYAARDSRVRVVHLTENVGLGRARNVGVEHASGDYLLFLDSDDSYTPGHLRAVDERLRHCDDPDLLVFDHVRTQWWGRSGRSDAGHLLEKMGDRTFRVQDRPEYLRLFLVAWNKAFRRDFFLEQGFAFRPGLYEDAPVTYLAMVTAERVACLDRVGVEYRQRRQGAITKTPGRKHFDMFPQYEGLFATLDARPELAWARPLLFARALDHMLFALVRPERVMPRDRRAFYREIASFYRRHLPPDFTVPGGRRGVECRLLARAPYAAFEPFFPARRVLRKARSLLRPLRRRATSRVKKAYYRLHTLRPLDRNLAVFSSGHAGQAAGDPAALAEKARELAPHIRRVWVIKKNRAHLVPEGDSWVAPGSLAQHALMARAAYWFNDTPWTGSWRKRRGSVHVHTHQGAPVKRMGLDLLDKPGARHGVNVRAHLWHADRWDLSLVASAHAEEIWNRAYPCHYEALRSGSPRNDVLVQGDPGRAAATRERLGIPAEDTVVLYAPTTREYRKGGYVPRLDLERLAASLGAGRTLVVRLHPSLAEHPERRLELRDLHRRGVLVDATDEPRVQDLLLAADCLVTDYSSLMADFALLDRPIVLHLDDWASYQATRGTYLDLRTDAPGPVTASQEELARVLGSEAWRDEESAARRAAFRARLCTYEDGRAAERVVRHVLLGEPFEAPAPAELPPVREESATAAAS
ncbi:bifunctional glycosyltransferase/CDP-glycerol:glycerophosphate glycerophosphotransferase [Streptomyces indicus]|uniref:CDP-glycerol glycerophosphotransferase, TagB/SpsB family n=1 Tax=Streptomyces indicus TaxID=417292 RepID=A0A1G9FFB1_9ACTN|nr:bifunctional glycosyltransferase family 2 protein/CDP-glycerol:glycerophosphate glycerophosphotransferase [Streptomyces indicus]SDK87141.1 CDP-glycerol glycerophosphotransferase, TagB/SpsB family [Streptomyces indicus]